MIVVAINVIHGNIIVERIKIGTTQIKTVPGVVCGIVLRQGVEIAGKMQIEPDSSVVYGIVLRQGVEIAGFFQKDPVPGVVCGAVPC